MAIDNTAIAVIDFSTAASPLEPAWPSTHRALLPIAGKALVVHLIELLMQLGIKHVRFAGSIQQYAVAKKLGNGSEWGMKIRYSDLHGSDLLTQTLVEKKHCLYLVGDHLNTLHIDEFTSRGFLISAEPASPNHEAAYWAFGPTGFAKYRLTELDQNRYQSLPLETTADFLAANNLALKGKLKGIQVPGKSIAEHVTVDWDTSIEKDSLLGENVSIGKHCRIGKRVTLLSNCSIGNGAIISHDCKLKNVVVLPNCFVGRGSKLQDAVITPMGIFDLEGKFWPVENQSILGRSRANRENVTGIPSHRLSSIESRLRNNNDLLPTNLASRLSGNIKQYETHGSSSKAEHDLTSKQVLLNFLRCPK